jgi:hypothetical protein
MTRRLLNLVTVLSLLLSVATAALSAWSFSGQGSLLCGGWSEVNRVVQGGSWCAACCSGEFRFARVHFQYQAADEEQLDQLREALGPRRVWRVSAEKEPDELLHVFDLQYHGWRLLGVGYLVARSDPDGMEPFTDYRLTVPAWLPTTILAVLPLTRGVAAARRRRRRTGRCHSCGYDLTGNVSGVCPECGSAR